MTTTSRTMAPAMKEVYGARPKPQKVETRIGTVIRKLPGGGRRP